MDHDRETIEYERIRGAALGRDHPQCQSCGSTPLARLGPNPDFQSYQVWYCKECELVSTYPPVEGRILDEFYAKEYSDFHAARLTDFNWFDLRAGAQVELIRRSGLLAGSDGGLGCAGPRILD